RLRQSLDELGAFGPRSDQSHIAAKHVEELRQLVQAKLAYHRAHARDAVVARAGPPRLTVRLGVLDHAAELVKRENLAAIAHAALTIEHRGPILEQDGERADAHYRRRQYQQGRRGDEVEHARAELRPHARLEALREDQPGRMHEVDLDLARLSLEKGQQVDHGDACELALEQIADRKAAPAVVDRNHDLVDVLRLRVGRKRPFELRHALVVDDPVVA